MIAAWLLVAAVAAPVVLTVVRRPQRGLLLLAALVPFDGLLLLIGSGGSMAGWKEALLLIVVVASFVCPPSARRATDDPVPGWVPGVVAFTALGLMSALAVGGSQGLLGAKVGFFYMLVAIAAWRCPLDRTERDRLVTVLMSVGVVTAVYGLVQQRIGHQRLSELGYEYNSAIRFTGGYMRSFSTFIQPFPFAFFLALVLLVGIAQLLEEPHRLRNRLFLLTTPVLVAALATTFVRGGWLALAAGLMYLAFTRHHVLLLAVAPAIVGVALLPAETSAAVLSASSSEARLSGWQTNVDTIIDHPLGLGIGSTGAVAASLSDAPVDVAVPVAEPGGRAPYQPDNYFVKTWLEFGVIGLWLLIISMVAVLAAVHRAVGPGRDGALAAGTASFVVAALAASTVSTFFEIFPMDVYFWLLVAVVSSTATAARRADVPRHTAGTAVVTA
jgi:hypothetical protein